MHEARDAAPAARYLGDLNFFATLIIVWLGTLLVWAAVGASVWLVLQI